jgi:superfamily II DNA or RNA helicase
VDSPGDRFRDSFLSKRPKSQWPSYIDETAVDVSGGIGIGDTGLDSIDFGREVGPLYAIGLRAVVGDGSDVSRAIGDTVSEEELGTIAYRLNELSNELQRGGNGLRDVRHAVEVLIRKITASETDRTLGLVSDGGTAAVSDLVVEMLADRRVAENLGPIVDEFERSAGGGLLARLDHPQMTTPLWNHQREALGGWADAGYRGYADMATATGKTVLGLAAIALRYGDLHPDDAAVERADSGPGADRAGKDRVLIAAQRALILEQWRREFDTHLNVPKERTSGSDTVELSWGTLEFRTAQSLVNEDRNEYDLVILDEAHHYVGGGEWGELLEEFDGEILALSGSVSDAGVDSEEIQERLREAVGPEVMRYSIVDAQADGVIPAFDWEIRYAPYETAPEFAEVTRAAEADFQAFQARLSEDEVGVNEDVRLETYEDVRRFSHTTEGRELKDRDPAFKELTSELFARRTRRWNASPSLASVVEVAVDHPNDHVIVLADDNAQVETLAERLRDRGVHDEVVVATAMTDRSTLRDRLDDYDDAEGGGVLVGTGDLLGEGVDVPNASVGINMATGGVNAALVQRIGRVLRNPAGVKHSRFYNVVGVPCADEAVPREDGLRLIEDAAQFCTLGSGFDNVPGFAAATDTDDGSLSEQLQTGAEFYRTLAEHHDYDLPDDPIESEHLRELVTVVRSSAGQGIDTVLASWSEYGWIDRPDSVNLGFVVEDEDDEPVAGVDVSLTDGADRFGTTDGDGRVEFSIDEGATSVEIRADPPQDSFGAVGGTIQAEDGLSYRIELPTKEPERDPDEDEPDDVDESGGSGPEGGEDEGEHRDDPDEDDGGTDYADLPVAEGEDETAVQAVRAVAQDLNAVPKTIEFEHLGSISLDRALQNYSQWHDLLVAAGIADGLPPTVSEDAGSDTGGDEDESEDDEPDWSPEPNAVAEWYESLGELADVVETLVALDGFGTTDQVAVMEQWVDELTARRGDGTPISDRLAQLPFEIDEYREAFGDCERVRQYGAIETTDLPEVVRAILVPAGAVPEERRWHLPLAPESSEPIPVVVTTEEALEPATTLLDEVDRAVQPDGSEGSAVDDGSDVSDYLEAVRTANDSVEGPIERTDVAAHSAYDTYDYEEHFESWEDALAAAGISRREQLLEEMDRVRTETNGPVDSATFDEHSRIGREYVARVFPGWSVFERAYEEWDGAQERDEPSDGDEDDPSDEAAELLEAIRRVDESIDGPIKVSDVTERSEFNSSSYRGLFDSWEEAMAAAGVDRREQLLQEMDRIRQIVGREIKTKDFGEHSRVSGGYPGRVFGSWSAFRDSYREWAENGGDGEEELGLSPGSSPVLADIPDNERFRDEILLRVIGIEDGESRTDVELIVKDATGERARLSVWSTHQYDGDWTTGQWYVFSQIRLRRWDGDDGGEVVVSSTRDFDAYPWSGAD